MPKKHQRKFTNFEAIERSKNELIPEEFPEGAFGSPVNSKEPVEGKSTPWEEGQKRMSAFVYPDEEQHDDLPRQLPGSHPLHDE
ncbi:hypothetical protein D8M04_04720 [Oceanobacillus piezotolerans]|uniref:Cytosolic protein n=1 Tax=Oceanobacillus piezotolerans TaxID=2448030 RepID=A0A498D764_9BACI|nr:hypothetical protein [Oceanobacillus piezotolerans]RLL46515.1 hypothetical protein D8M04_04720 [Oceanobacillus piezotolerans]